MAGVFVLMAFGGFTPTYWAHVASGTFHGPPILHIHGALLFSWALFYFMQTAWIASEHTPTHRAWGLAGIALFSVMMCSDGALTLLADPFAGDFQVVLRLQVLPELRTRSEVPRQPQCHLRRNRPSPSHYFIDRWRGHTEFLRHLVRAQFQRPHEIVEQDIPGMYGP